MGAVPPGFAAPPWWQLLSRLAQADLENMDLRSSLRSISLQLLEDPCWSSSGLVERLFKALALAPDSHLQQVVKDISALASAGFQAASAAKAHRSRTTSSGSGSDEDCANSQPSCELVSSPISTASSPTTSGDTNSQEFAVPLPRSRPRPSSVVWNTAIRLELPGANSVSVTSVSLCSARMVVPSFCCDSGLPQRLMFDSLVKRQGVTLGRHQACRTTITSTTAAQLKRLQTLAKQELCAVCNLGTHSLIFVPFEDARKGMCAVTFLAAAP